MNAFRSTIPNFTLTVMCVFVLVMTGFGISVYATLWRPKHAYAIDGPNEPDFVVFIVLPLMMPMAMGALFFDLLRYFPHLSRHA